MASNNRPEPASSDEGDPRLKHASIMTTADRGGAGKMIVKMGAIERTMRPCLGRADRECLKLPVFHLTFI